jgi:hypothetical protein
MLINRIRRWIQRKRKGMKEKKNETVLELIGTGV